MNACCIICSDRFIFGDDDELSIAAGKCGHTFHSRCLDTWLANSSTCPKCRQKWTKKEVVKKLYFEYDNSVKEYDSESRLLNDLNSSKAQLAHAKQKAQTLTEQLNEALTTKEVLCTDYNEVCDQLKTVRSEKHGLQNQLQFYQGCEQSWRQTEKECTKLKELLQNYQQIERLVKDSENDGKDLVKSLMSGSGATDRLANMCVIMKREYMQCKRAKKLQRLELDQTRKELASLRVHTGEIQSENKILKEQCQRMEQQLNEAEKREETLRMQAAKRRLETPTKSVVSTSLTNEENLLLSSSSSSSSSFLDHSKELHFGSSNVFSIENSNNENNNPPMNFKLTSAASRKSRHQPTTSQSLEVSSKAIIDRSPQVPILQNFRRGYDGLGGHTSFTKSTLSRVNNPLRTINQKNPKAIRRNEICF